MRTTTGLLGDETPTATTQDTRAGANAVGAVPLRYEDDPPAVVVVRTEVHHYYHHAGRSARVVRERRPAWWATPLWGAVNLCEIVSLVSNPAQAGDVAGVALGTTIIYGMWRAYWYLPPFRPRA